MPFTLLTVRAGTDPDTDDRLFPTLSPADERYPIVLTDADQHLAPFVAKSLTVTRGTTTGSGQTLLKLPKHKIDVYVTDARVILHCDKYEKGSTWTGMGAIGLPIALAATAISKTAAAIRRRGKAMVGHVRYPWLYAVEASPRVGALDTNELRLTIKEAEKYGNALVSVVLNFPKEVPVLEIARDIAQHVAKLRLEHDPALSAEERTQLEALTNVALPTPQRDKFVGWQLPAYRGAEAESAHHLNPGTN